MDPINAYWLSRARMAEAHAQAAEDHLARQSRCAQEAQKRAASARALASASSASGVVVSRATCSWFERLRAVIRRLAPARLIAPRL
jgi:hypothetical protein